MQHRSGRAWGRRRDAAWFLLVGGLGACAEPAPSRESLPGPRPEGCDRASPYDVDAMTDDLAFLASPALDGRAPGTAGDRAAREFVAERFACLGLAQVGVADGYHQPFTDADGNDTGNVLARIDGSPDGLPHETIVVSAHVDHFGFGWLGANDNASGVSALLAIAHDLVAAEAPPRRAIVFAVFGAEETGFEGSEHFMAHPPSGVDPGGIVYDVNLDMVGSYTESGTVFAIGTTRGTPGRAVVDAQAAAFPDLDVTPGGYSGQSDHHAFCARGIPYAFFWTEDAACYHRRCDTSGRIDYPALSDIAALAGGTTRGMADGAGDLAADVRAGVNVCRPG